MTLHIVSKSPHSSNALTDCLAALTEGDALLLTEDGVYAAVADLPQQLTNQAIYCLQADADARGVTIAASWHPIDDTRWVALCTAHTPIVSWFK